MTDPLSAFHQTGGRPSTTHRDGHCIVVCLLRRVCCQHGWVYDNDGYELSVVGHGLWMLVEGLRDGVEVASERLLERLLAENLLR